MEGFECRYWESATDSRCSRLTGGEVRPSPSGEFGYARLKVTDQNSRLFTGLPGEMDVWMSHGDHMTSVPPGFQVTAVTADALNAFEDASRGIFGVQFHPEVAHTPLGAQVLRNFLFSICECRGDWSPAAVIEEQTTRIRDQIGGMIMSSPVSRVESIRHCVRSCSSSNR